MRIKLPTLPETDDDHFRKLQDAFVERWQFGPLVRVAPGLLEEIPIPERDKRFLYEIGLPLGGVCNPSAFRTLEDGMRSIWDVWCRPPAYQEALSPFYLLGRGDEGCQTCMTPEGLVVHIDGGETVKVDVVNSCLPAYALCLLEFHTELTHTSEEFGEDALPKLARRLRKKLRAVDPEVLSLRKRSYWGDTLWSLATGWL